MKNKQLNTVESKIGVLDTSISSMNVGDYIIMDSAYKRINSVFDNAQKLVSQHMKELIELDLNAKKK